MKGLLKIIIGISIALMFSANLYSAEGEDITQVPSDWWNYLPDQINFHGLTHGTSPEFGGESITQLNTMQNNIHESILSFFPTGLLENISMYLRKMLVGINISYAVTSEIEFTGLTQIKEQEYKLEFSRTFYLRNSGDPSIVASLTEDITVVGKKIADKKEFTEIRSFTIDQTFFHYESTNRLQIGTTLKADGTFEVNWYSNLIPLIRIYREYDIEDKTRTTYFIYAEAQEHVLTVTEFPLEEEPYMIYSHYLIPIFKVRFPKYSPARVKIPEVPFAGSLRMNPATAATYYNFDKSYVDPIKMEDFYNDFYAKIYQPSFESGFLYVASEAINLMFPGLTTSLKATGVDQAREDLKTLWQLLQDLSNNANLQIAQNLVNNMWKKVDDGTYTIREN